jgi:hypothetical protein
MRGSICTKPVTRIAIARSSLASRSELVKLRLGTTVFQHSPDRIQRVASSSTVVLVLAAMRLTGCASSLQYRARDRRNVLAETLVEHRFGPVGPDRGGAS